MMIDLRFRKIWEKKMRKIEVGMKIEGQGM